MCTSKDVPSIRPHGSVSSVGSPFGDMTGIDSLVKSPKWKLNALCSANKRVEKPVFTESRLVANDSYLLTLVLRSRIFLP
jgi:hypothetical protein